MFRSATTRIAHSSTIPSIGGNLNKDLRALQELINAEKTVLTTLQRLSSEIAKASESLRQWGTGEGDDLGDISTAAGSLLLHYASALSRFASHEEAIREQMKSIRSREEQLDELKRRRKSVASKADTAEKKLSKMNPDNKNVQAQTDILSRLRDEMRSLDTEIMNEEASLGDFKRYSIKQWLGLKFGGLQECCQKGTIVGEFGKLVIAEVPLSQTQPGLPRPYYNGHARTEYLVTEANRLVSEVYFSTEPNPNQSSHVGPSPVGSETTSFQQQQQPSYFPPQSPPQLSRPLSMQFTGAAEVVGSSYPPPMPMGPQEGAMTVTPSRNSTYGSFVGLPQVPAQTTTSDFGLSPYLGGQGPAEGNPQMNEFGQYNAPGPYAPRTTSMNNLSRGNETQPTSPVDGPGGPRAARFATFPVKGGRPPPGASQSPTMSPLVAPAPRMDERPPSIDLHRNDSSFSSSVAAALGTQWPAGSPAPPTQPLHLHGDVPQASVVQTKAQEANQNKHGSYSPPPPVYTPEPQPGSSSAVAPPTMPPPELGKVEEEGQDDVQLAYMSNPEDSDRESASHHPDRADRRVRFGSIRDVETELAKREAEQQQQQQQHNEQQEQSSIPPVGSPPTPSSPPSQSEPSSPPMASPSPIVVTAHRTGPPSTEEDYTDEEKALNAAAAREVSRELDALMFTSPLAPHPPPPPVDRTPSPLEPPHPPFARNAGPRMDTVSQAPASRRESLLSPLSPRNEPQYVRERDRAERSAPTSPAASQASYTVSPPISEIPPPPPPNINLPERSTSSFGTPYRTPPEHPTHGGSGSIYNMAGMTGSASSFGTGGKISAAAFKRQIRSPGSLGGQSPDPSSEIADVSPLSVKKRGALPGSPYPSRLTPGDTGASMQRVPSAPTYGSGASDQGNWQQQQQPRSTSAGNAPGDDEGGHRRYSEAGGGGQDEEFDYISAYVNNSPRQGGFEHSGLR